MQTILIVLFIFRCAVALIAMGYYAVKEEAKELGGSAITLLINAVLLLGVIYYY